MPRSRPVPEVLSPPGPFWTFNREERNACAILFGLLSVGDNLTRFCELVGWKPEDLDEAEISVEWTYLRDLWWWHSSRTDATTLRQAILDALQPSKRNELAAVSILEFNTHFGAVPRPSDRYIQSPGNWSVVRFSEHVPDNDEFIRTCIFKWSFNVKPDIVVQTPSGKVLSVEAKWDSGEGQYPASGAEKKLFASRSLDHISQTAVQRYLVDELLGFDGSFVYLARRSDMRTSLGHTVTWAETLQALELTAAPQFIQNWSAREINSDN